MPRRPYPRAQRYTDAYGKTRWRWRKGSFQRALPGRYGEPQWVAAYHAAQAEYETPGAGRYPPKSLGALVAIYRASKAYRDLADKPGRDHVLNQLQPFADRLVTAEAVTAPRAQAFLDRWSDKPGTQANLRSVLRTLFSIAIRKGWRIDNPFATATVSKPARPGGFVAWTGEQVDQYLSHHPRDSVASLTVRLALATGAARVDLCRLGPSNLVGDCIAYKRSKTSRQPRAPEIVIPIAPDLLEELRACTTEVFLIGPNTGRAFSPQVLSLAVRKWIRAAGLPDELGLHGLRKRVAVTLAEAGCSPHEIAAITGHRSLAELTHYSEAFNRRALARTAMEKVSAGRSREDAHQVETPNTQKGLEE